MIKINIIEFIKKSIDSICAKYINDNIKEDEILPIFYVAGSQTLPPPLSTEEEETIKRLESEDECVEAKKLLVERNLRLVVYIAKKFENTGIGIEDLISIGTIGLMKGVNTFNSEKKIKLATYASRCIENEILMYLRRNNKIKSEVSIDEPLNKDSDGNELLLSDILGTEADITYRKLEDEVDMQLLKEAIKKLNDREKNIMEMRFGFISGKERTQKEVADELGISQSYISRLEKKIINKMKKDMGKDLNNKMFCFQCEQTAGCAGCMGAAGVCGKTANTSRLQDELTGAVIGLAKSCGHNEKSERTDRIIIEGLFTTVTNVNFNDKTLEDMIEKVHKEKEAIAPNCITCAAPCGNTEDFDMNLLWNEDEDIRSLKSLILFGIRGMAAYAYHAMVLGYESEEVNQFFYKALSIITYDLEMDRLIEVAMEVGEKNLKCMELLDKANTSSYGTPTPVKVPLTIEKGPFIVITGHDLKDLEVLLKQTEGKGINIYTHGEMLPAHGYPELKKYPHLKGNFGTAWQNQQKEFDNIPAPVLFTTNCLMPVKKSYKDRVFTTEVVSYPEMVHIEGDGEEKDFTPVINKALELGGYKEDKENTGINGGKYVVTGFGHGSVLSVADKIIEAVENKQISHFFLVGGCDGAKVGRNYYTEFVKQSPKDSVILTLACGKYRFNDLDLGEICGLPRIMDMGQCNDAYGAIKVAIALSKAFGCEVNELPLSMILSWYEQKAVCILLTLLHLGIKNIFLGPTLPAFISPNVLKYLVENYNISPISTPEADLKKILG